MRLAAHFRKAIGPFIEGWFGQPLVLEQDANFLPPGRIGFDHLNAIAASCGIAYVPLRLERAAVAAIDDDGSGPLIDSSAEAIEIPVAGGLLQIAAIVVFAGIIADLSVKIFVGLTDEPATLCELAGFEDLATDGKAAQ